MNEKEICILLLWCELVLLCCECSYELKYLYDVNFYTDKNSKTLYITYRYIDEMYSSIYSRNQRNYSLSPWHYSWYLLHTSIATECVYRYISENMGIVPLHPTMFMVFIIYRYKDEMCLSIYSRNHGNCSPSPWHC